MKINKFGKEIIKIEEEIEGRIEEESQMMIVEDEIIQRQASKKELKK